MLSVVVARSYLGGRCLVFSPEESQTCFCWASQSSLGEAFSSQSEKEACLLSVSFPQLLANQASRITLDIPIVFGQAHELSARVIEAKMYGVPKPLRMKALLTMVFNKLLSAFRMML